MRLVWVLLCSVPLAAAPVELSLKRAVQLAVSPEGNTQVRLTEEALKQAESRTGQARAALLPDLSAAFTDQNLTRNLAAQGIQVTVPIPGFHFPSFVGPFTTMDARVSASQSVFDFSSIRRFQASKVGVSAARSDVNGNAEQVAAQVARAYLAAVRADADVESAKANVTLSEAVLQQAENQKSAGTGTGIEITRARVQLANDRQRLLVAENARRSAGLQLLRGIGLRLDTELVLTDKLQYVPVDAVTMEQAKAQAMTERPDLEAQQERESNDLKEQIELDVRLALDALRSAEEQVKVSKEGLELAENELAQARRRYEAGVAIGVEVTDAQSRLERARDNQTTALYNYNVGRIDLAQAMGAVRRSVE